MTRRVSVWVAVAVAVLMAGTARAANTGTGASGLRAVFERANASYDAGDYDEAVSLYGELVEAGVENADLFYNLGNAYYKTGQVGRAILNYERARRLAPRGEDIAENLSLARSLVRDRQFVDEAGWLHRAVMWPHDSLSTRETFVLTSVWYGLLILALLGLVFRDTKWVSRVYAPLSMLSPGRLLGLDKTQDFILAICTTFLLAAVTGTSAYAKYREETQRARGVVVQEEVAVYSGPSTDSTLQFKVHEGTVVRVADERDRWAQVRLPGGLAGWVPRGTFERI